MLPQYLVIDQKSYYATVECVARGLDPMKTNLVVADPDRSQNTICLAVSPSMKALGVKNRCRIRDIPGNIKYIVAPPRMQLYIDCAAEIHGVFLKHFAPQDIFTYSIDESFIDATPYLKMYKRFSFISHYRNLLKVEFLKIGECQKFGDYGYLAI